MARQKLSDLLERYRGELRRSKKWRRDDGYDDKWCRLVDLYRGRHYEKAVLEDRLVVNMAFATINVIAPSIAINNPKISVNARREDVSDQAVIAEQVVNYHWRSGKFQQQVRLAVNDMLMVGCGYVKVGYTFEEMPAPAVADEDQLDEEAVPAEEHYDGIAEYPCTESLAPRRIDRPFVERVSYKDIFVDPDATSPETMRWICQRVRRQFGDVKNDTRYNAKARKLVQPTSRDHYLDEDNQEHVEEDQHKGNAPGGYVDVYEFYDLKDETVSIFTESSGEFFLVKPKPNPFTYGNPFVMLRDYEVPDQFYPMGELEAIEVLQNELNETRTALMQHRKKFQPKWLYNRAAFEDDGLKALKDDRYNTMVPVESGIPLGEAVAPMPTTIAPAEYFAQGAMIRDDIDIISGVSDYMRGAAPEVRRTATEAAMMQDSQQSRAADKLARIESFLSQVAERVLQVLQQFTTGEQVYRVVGINGFKAWLPYEREDIEGQFDFEVEAGSTQPKNESTKRAAALQMMEVMGPFIETGVVNVPMLLQHVLHEGFGVKNPQNYIMAPVPIPGMGVPGQQQALPPGAQPPAGPGMPGIPSAQGPIGAVAPQPTMQEQAPLAPAA